MRDSIGSPLRGVSLLAVAVLLFACMDMGTKILAASYSIPLIMAVRYIVNLVLMVAVLAPKQGRALFKTQRTALVIIRGLCLVVGSLFVGLALQRMPMAETTAIVFLAPILVVLVSRPLLGETIGIWGWAAVFLGFAGVLLIVRPGGGLDPVGVAGLSVTVLVTVAYNLLSRVLAATETTSAMLFYSALAGSICFGAVLPWTIGGPAPSTVDLLLFLSLGILGGLGHFLFTAAFRYTPASILAPVSYLQLVWVGLLGWLAFGHVPDLLTVAGMAVVSAAGIMVALRSATSERPKGANRAGGAI